MSVGPTLLSVASTLSPHPVPHTHYCDNGAPWVHTIDIRWIVSDPHCTHWSLPVNGCDLWDKGVRVVGGGTPFGQLVQRAVRRSRRVQILGVLRSPDP